MAADEKANTFLQFRYGPFSLRDSFDPNSGDFWSLNIGELEAQAERIEKSESDLIYADEIRKQVKQLKEVIRHPDEAHRRIKAVLGEGEFTVFPEAFLLCKAGDVEMLDLLANLSLKYCAHIAFLAAAGNQPAAHHLARLAILATTQLGQLTEKQPNTFKPIAFKELAWPIMKSSHPYLGTPVPNWDELGLGKGYPFKLDPSRRFRLHTPVGKLAWKLWNYVFDLKSSAESFLEWKKIELDPFKQKISRKKPLTIPESAVALPTFTGKSEDIDKWWALAELCLVSAFHSYSNPHILNENAPIFANLVAAVGHQRTASTRRARILHKLKEEFYSFAGFTNQKRKKS